MLKGEALARYNRREWAVAHLTGVKMRPPTGIMPYEKLVLNPDHPRRFCSDRCFEARQGGEQPYAPCPLIPDRRYHADELCRHCGWVIPEGRL